MQKRIDYLLNVVKNSESNCLGTAWYVFMELELENYGHIECRYFIQIIDSNGIKEVLIYGNIHNLKKYDMIVCTNIEKSGACHAFIYLENGKIFQKPGAGLEYPYEYNDIYNVLKMYGIETLNDDEEFIVFRK